MKIDRLLGIIIYLLNRDIVSARELAEKFEVSVRTIQRDMDSLTMAGIPIYAEQGASGGYGILDHYRMSKQLMSTDDFYFITTALRGLCSAYDHQGINQTLEKVEAIHSGNVEGTYSQNDFYIDFTAFQNSETIKTNFKYIDEALKNNQVIDFEYTTSGHQHSKRQVEPLTIAFKWYAWYLLGYCRKRSDFRMFKIARMRNIKVLNDHYVRREFNPEAFLNPSKRQNDEGIIHLKLEIDTSIKIDMEEIYKEARFTKLSDTTYLLEVTLPRNNNTLMGTIMCFGNKAKVIEPIDLKKMILEKTDEIRTVYT